jgi:5'-methylthioadenosine phosphorylase
MSENPVLAVIGGSGLYDLTGLSDVREIPVATPFGSPSAPVVEGRLGGNRLLFLARHGQGHRFTPSEINYRANIFALKSLGATRVVGVSAVGSLREDIQPGHLVVVDQFIDRTRGRPATFFGGGVVGHVMFADPVCPELSRLLVEAARGLGLTVHDRGTLLVMEGPAFSTRAESLMHRKLGLDLIGMTAMPEAKLAREAELCYATLALATDYDCWHESEEAVTVEAVIRVLAGGVKDARAVLAAVAGRGSDPRTCGCATALEHAVITDRRAIPAETAARLEPIMGRVL